MRRLLSSLAFVVTVSLPALALAQFSVADVYTTGHQLAPVTCGQVTIDQVYLREFAPCYVEWTVDQSLSQPITVVAPSTTSTSPMSDTGPERQVGTPAQLNVLTTPYGIRSLAVTDATPITVLQVSLINPPAPWQGYAEAVEVEALSFRLRSQNTSVDYDLFQLLHGGVEQPVADDGTVTLSLASPLRLAPGEGTTLDISIRLAPASSYGTVDGSFTLDLTEVFAAGQSSEPVRIITSGTTASDLFAFQSLPSNPTGTKFVLQRVDPALTPPVLTPNERHQILELELDAQFSEITLEEITIKNIAPNADGQEAVARLHLSDLAGNTLGSGEFLGERATLRFSPPLVLPRGSRTRYVMSLDTNPSIAYADPSQAILRLAITDVEAYASTGLPVTPGQLLAPAPLYEATLAGAHLTVRNADYQPPAALNASGALEPLYAFTIENPSEDERVALSRLSLQVDLDNLQWAGGTIDPSDVMLTYRASGDVYQQDPLWSMNVTSFSPTSGLLRFDASTELLLLPEAERDYVLFLALEDPLPTNPSESVTFTWLTDGQFQTGTVSDLQSANANIIWSDRSAATHSITTIDWRSGLGLSLPPTTQLED